MEHVHPYAQFGRWDVEAPIKGRFPEQRASRSCGPYSGRLARRRECEAIVGANLPPAVDWSGQIETAREVDVETRQAEDAAVHRTTIWAVVDEGDVFVRSWRGATSRWYREITANPVAVLHVEEEAIPVRAVPASDPDSVERASAGYRRKYGDSSAVDSMVRDEILDTTIRLEPEPPG